MKDKANIIRTVEESFSDIVHPGDESLFATWDPGVDEFLKMIEGKDWRSFLGVLENSEFAMAQFYGNMVSLMTPEAIHYFAPAYLIFSMNENADVVGETFTHLLEHDNRTSGKTQRVLDLFSDQQKRAASEVAEYNSLRFG